MTKLQITETQIDNYNETNNKFQKFDNGLNIICGQNEAGKSTMMDFIKNIFTKKSSSAKGYIKCEIDGKSFNLVSGDSKKLKENEQYISKLSPHEFQTGFIINLDDIMFAKKANSEELVNTIKDSSGNAVNKKQDEYYNYIYVDKKHKFTLTPKNGLSTDFKKQFEKLNELNTKIRELQSKEEEYNNILISLDNIDKEIKLLTQKSEYHEILSDKNSLLKEKENIILNPKLISKKSDFDKIREEFGVLKSLKSKINIIENELKENKTDLDTKTEILAKSDILASENINIIEPNSDNYKQGKLLIDKKKNIEFEKTTLNQKIKDKEQHISKAEFEIKSIENQLKTTGIEDIQSYKDDREMLESYKNRYSELNDNKKTSDSDTKLNDRIYLSVMSLILCASILTLALYWNSTIKIPLIIFCLISFFGLSAVLIRKFRSNGTGNCQNEEAEQIKKEVRELCRKYGFEFSKSDNFIVKMGAYLQKMNDNCSEYKHIFIDLQKENERLEKEKAELEEIKTQFNEIEEKFGEFQTEEQEFLNNMKISSLDNFDEIYEKIKEIKSLENKISDRTKEIEDIDNQSEMFVEKLNKFIEDSELKNYKKYNKYDDIEPIINEIGDILYENIANNTKLSETETKINELDNRMKTYPVSFKEDDNENSEELKTQLQTKTDERGRLRQQKEDLESVSNLINLRNEKNIELNRIKTAINNLIQKEVVYNLIKTAKEEFNKTQPNLICAKEYFSKITDGKYSDIDFETKTISGENIGDKDWDNLSRGTKEQLYLALRLGYAKNYSKDIEGNLNGKPDLPIIIDDAFVNFDTSRTTAMIKCLSEFSKNNQVLYFTCHSQEIKDILNKQKIKHNYIEL